MEFLKSTADLLTFQMVSAEMDDKNEEHNSKMNGGISVYSIMDKRDEITGGSTTMLPLGTLRDTYIPIGLYLDERLPKNEVVFGYSDCQQDYAVIEDDLYDKLVDSISLRKNRDSGKKYSAGKTLKLKSIFKRMVNISNKTAKKI